MKDMEMSDFELLEDRVADAFSVLEKEGAALSGRSDLTRQEKRRLNKLRIRLRKLHADAWELGEDISARTTGEVTTRGGST